MGMIVFRNYHYTERRLLLWVKRCKICWYFSRLSNSMICVLIWCVGRELPKWARDAGSPKTIQINISLIRKQRETEGHDFSDFLRQPRDVYNKAPSRPPGCYFIVKTMDVCMKVSKSVQVSSIPKENLSQMQRNAWFQEARPKSGKCSKNQKP